MSSMSILEVLDQDYKERDESRELRSKAATTIERINQTSTTELPTVLPDALLELITQVIKPLFSGEQHEKLSSTGRKNLVDNTLPTAANRFSGQILFDEDSKPMWKNGWTFPLLTYILESYASLREDALRKKVVEAHFYLLVPAILRQIDDVEVAYKSDGCECLRLLCNNLANVKSNILKQSGLTDVFIDALKNDFSMLPTLTPEKDSLKLFQSLYPAFRGLLLARFCNGPDEPQASSKKSSARFPKKEVKSDEDLRQSYLTLLLRHQCLHSLSHLSTGTGAGSTMSVSLSTFFLSQVAWIVSDMGIHATIHLQSILPLLRSVLSDPFSTSAPEMLLGTVKTLRAIVQVCWVRIRDKWWEECLRGIVSCWLNIADEGNLHRNAGSTIESAKQELVTVACLLEDIVGKPLRDVKEDLIGEEPLLERLFDIETLQ